MEGIRIKKWRRLVSAATFFFTIALLPTPLFADSYTLDDLFRIALASSEKLQLAEQNVALAQIGTQKARSWLYPRLIASGGLTQYSERKYTAAGGILQPERASAWGVRMDETLSLSGRELTALEISRQFLDKSRQDAAALREDFLFSQVTAAFYDVLLAARNLEIAAANLERLKRHRDAAEKRLRIGEVTKTALLRAEGELSGAHSDRLQAKNILEMAMIVLANQVGIELPFTLKPPPDQKNELPDRDELQKQALLLRPELRSLQIQKEIAAGRIRVAEGAFLPTLTLTGAYAGADQNPASTSLNRESFYGGIALNFPLFDGGLRKAEVAEAKIGERQVELRLEDLKKEIGVEVLSAHLDLETVQGTQRFLADQLSFASENYRAVSRQFEFGLADSLDVVDANALLVSTERKAAAAAFRVQLAALRLRKAAGMPLAAASNR